MNKMFEKLKLTVPFPPSTNHYMGRNGSQAYKTSKAKAYNQLIYFDVRLQNANLKLDIPLFVTYNFWMPDKRKRDIANYEKVLTDSLVVAGVMIDDNIIHKWQLEKMGFMKNGQVEIIIKPYQHS